ncbi:integron cassette protein [Colletotrichum karsti]|uniref:Integron cassette protein n=1 Tax=Colletotrichum karsti TaxID=1095194 RepID=A0A9P6HW53_9PEZI|nr:integron cassette protein [Colletotrichum karsti]KAF9871923.1 integron cassette protein [Colletotrichum karsti]
MKFPQLSLGLLAALTTSTAATEPPSAPQSYCPPRPATPAKQRAILEELTQTLLIEKNFGDGVPRFFAEDYIQHEPSALSGRGNALNALLSLPAAVKYVPVHKGVDNDHAWVFERMEVPGAETMAVAEFFRFNGTCIQEHWNVYMTKPPNSTNPLPLW